MGRSALYVRVPTELKKELDEVANDKLCSINGIVVELIDRYLKEQRNESLRTASVHEVGAEHSGLRQGP